RHRQAHAPGERLDHAVALGLAVAPVIEQGAPSHGQRDEDADEGQDKNDFHDRRLSGHPAPRPLLDAQPMPSSRSLIVLLATVVGVGATASLGRWQLNRAAEKTALHETMQARSR